MSRPIVTPLTSLGKMVHGGRGKLRIEAIAEEIALKEKAKEDEKHRKYLSQFPFDEDFYRYFEGFFKDRKKPDSNE